VAVFTFKVQKLICSHCGQPVDPAQIKLAYFAKSRGQLDKFDRSKMEIAVFKHAFPNLELAQPLNARKSLTEEPTIVYGIALLHPNCELIMESWLEYLVGFSVRLQTKTGEGFVMMPNPLPESITGTISTECVICAKSIFHNGKEFYVALWDEEEFVFCSSQCLQQGIPED